MLDGRTPTWPVLLPHRCRSRPTGRPRSGAAFLCTPADNLFQPRCVESMSVPAATVPAWPAPRCPSPSLTSQATSPNSLHSTPSCGQPGTASSGGSVRSASPRPSSSTRAAALRRWAGGVTVVSTGHGAQAQRGCPIVRLAPPEVPCAASAGRLGGPSRDVDVSLGRDPAASRGRVPAP